VPISDSPAVASLLQVRRDPVAPGGSRRPAVIVAGRPALLPARASRERRRLPCVARQGRLFGAQHFAFPVSTCAATASSSAHSEARQTCGFRPASEVFGSSDRFGNCRWLLPRIHENALLRIDDLDTGRAADASGLAGGEDQGSRECQPRTCSANGAVLPLRRGGAVRGDAAEWCALSAVSVLDN
jgi:hypothetical protein